MKSYLRLSLVLLCFSFLSCSSTDKNSDNPETVFNTAQEFEKDERYEEAIRRYQDVKNKFPYSHFATKAELAIADVHYKDEAYPEAQVSYQSFRDLHPKHAQIDYVVFRIGMSYFMQLPDSIDRDLTLAQDAITAFDDLINNYPKSTYLSEAKEKRNEGLRKLAEKEDYIAEFYFKREMYLSAFKRYEGLIDSYPEYDISALTLSRAAISAHKASRNDKAKIFLKKLRDKYPGSTEYSDARKVLE